MLVHLAAAEDVAHIKRVGLSIRRSRSQAPGVYAMPLLPDYFASHQWLRELKRGTTKRTLVAVDFRIADDEIVKVGHYAQAHLDLPASEAVRVVMEAEDPRGYEVIVPRSIRAKEIHRVRAVRQVVGWRYSPGAHGRRPCGCPVCLTPGEPGSAKIRRSFED